MQSSEKLNKYSFAVATNKQKKKHKISWNETQFINSTNKNTRNKNKCIQLNCKSSTQFMVDERVAVCKSVLCYKLWISFIGIVDEIARITYDFLWNYFNQFLVCERIEAVVKSYKSFAHFFSPLFLCSLQCKYYLHFVHCFPHHDAYTIPSLSLATKQWNEMINTF